MSGYSGTPLARKLGLKPNMRVRLLDPPDGYWSLFGDDINADDVSVLGSAADAGSAVDAPEADFTHLFATDPDALTTHLGVARAGMATDGMVWASWPKKSSGVESAVGRAEVMAAGKAAGLVDIKVAAVDETWSGLKFVIPVDDR